MYKIEIFDNNNLDEYGQYDATKLHFSTKVEKNELLKKFKELFLFFEGWQYRIIMPDESILIGGAMDPNDEDEILCHLKEERILELKNYVEQLKEGSEIEITVYDCFQGTATLLSIEENGIQIKICEDKDQITMCYSCQSNEGMENQVMFLDYSLIADIEQVVTNKYYAVTEDSLDAPTSEDIREEKEHDKMMHIISEKIETDFHNAIVDMLFMGCSLESMKAILEEEFKKFSGIKSEFNKKGKE